ncbi:MAG: hypothetical protein V8S24_03980 [Gordonibacter pamelaeae]
MLLMLGFTSYDMLGLSRLLSTIAAQDVSFYAVLCWDVSATRSACSPGGRWRPRRSRRAPACLKTSSSPRRCRSCSSWCLRVLVMACSYWGQPGSGKPGKDEAAVDSVGVWRRSCEDLCDAFGLSSREREVFALCAKGRDSAYICSALYISAPYGEKPCLPHL